MNVLSPFDEAVRDLSLAQHLPRIKKLLVYACTHHWETDPAGLASYHLHDLIQCLVQATPTYAGLKAHLHDVIQTLNKPAEYTLIANTIIRHLHCLYPEATAPSAQHYPALYRIAADQLIQDEEYDRIKKLLYFVCRGQWTQDLDAVDLLDLLEELHGLTPTHAELTTIFSSVVQNVSKPKKYQAIAQRIIKGLGPLYQAATQDRMDEAPPPPPILPLSPPAPAVRSKDRPVTPPAAPANARLSMRKKVRALSMDDWVAMRVEIHKFTNPLLAKYLLFMNSYAGAVGGVSDAEPGDWDTMIWEALKTTDLDTLLRDSLKSCRNVGEFERSLKRTTRKMANASQYKSVINAVVRAIQPTFGDCTGKESDIYAIPAPSLVAPTYGYERSPSTQSSQPMPPAALPHQRTAEKATLVEVGPAHAAAAGITETWSPPVAGSALEPTASDPSVNALDPTESESNSALELEPTEAEEESAVALEPTASEPTASGPAPNPSDPGAPSVKSHPVESQTNTEEDQTNADAAPNAPSSSPAPVDHEPSTLTLGERATPRAAAHPALDPPESLSSDPIPLFSAPRYPRSSSMAAHHQ